MSGLRLDAEVEVVLDVTRCASRPAGGEELAALWHDLEPRLHGPVKPGARWEIEQDGAGGAAGLVGVEVVRVAPGVTTAGPATRFGIGAVRELAALRYPCRDCAEQDRDTYGPFVCRACPEDGARRCDDHAVILDGALSATCDRHRPTCRACGAAATCWCQGPECAGRVAWCDAHRYRHPGDDTQDFCASCHDAVLPTCARSGCRSLGTVRCEHRADDGRACGARLCNAHARRWQVFGGERLGLGRCAAHHDTTVLGADDVLFQIVGGALWRRRPERLPSLSGFAHALRRSGHRLLALDLPAIHRRLAAPDRRLPNAPHLTRALEGAGRAWTAQQQRWEEDQRVGASLVDDIRAIVRADGHPHGEEIAAALALAEYKPARSATPALLFVFLPAPLQDAFTGRRHARVRAVGDHIGIRVRLENGGR